MAAAGGRGHTSGGSDGRGHCRRRRGWQQSCGGRGHTYGGANGYRGSSNAGGDGGHAGRQRWQQRLASSTSGDDGKSATDATDRKTHDPSLSSSNLPIAFYFLLQLFIRCSRTKGSNEAGFCWVSLRCSSM